VQVLLKAGGITSTAIEVIWKTKIDISTECPTVFSRLQTRAIETVYIHAPWPETRLEAPSCKPSK
jgi:hypothetical protein